jgi:hypothetical protein
MRPSAVVAFAVALTALAGCNGGGSSGPPGPPPTPVPTASPTPTPVPSPPSATGAWMYGLDASSNKALLHVDAGLATLGEITGSNTQLDLNNGVATDASANVYALRATVVNMYPSTASGNVPPASSTSITLPSNVVLGVQTFGLALDGSGGVFIGVFHTRAPDCEIVHAQLTGSTSNAVMAADCTSFATGNSASITQLVTDGRGFLYAGFYGPFNQPPSQAAIARYTIGAGGTLTLDATIVTPANSSAGPPTAGALFDVDKSGNIYVDYNGTILFYPASTFVSGQTVVTSRTGTDTFPGRWPLGVDGSGNMFAGYQFHSAGVVVIPSGSHTASAPNTFTASYVKGVRAP